MFCFRQLWDFGRVLDYNYGIMDVFVDVQLWDAFWTFLRGATFGCDGVFFEVLLLDDYELSSRCRTASPCRQGHPP